MAPVERQGLILPLVADLNVNSKTINYNPALREREFRSNDTRKEAPSDQRLNLCVPAPSDSCTRIGAEDSSELRSRIEVTDASLAATRSDLI